MEQPFILLAIIALTVGLFIWGKLRHDIIALIALGLATLTGAIPIHHVYDGLSNPAVVTVACVMVLSAAVNQSGLLRRFTQKLSCSSWSTTRHVAVLCGVTALLSAFMNNIGALMFMMPICIQTAKQSKRSPSMLLMPMALASALGGMTTLIGTPPNLLIASYRQQMTGQAFSLFDFSPVGLCVSLAGLIFITLVAWRLIPSDRKGAITADDIVHIKDYIVELKVPLHSPLVGQTIQYVEQLAKENCIIGLIRHNKTQLVIPGHCQLLADDILIIEANPQDAQDLITQGKLELIDDPHLSYQSLASDEFALIEAVIPPGSMVDMRSAKSIGLRSRFRVNLLGISRQGRSVQTRIKNFVLQAGDVVLLQGPRNQLNEISVSIGFLPLVDRNLSLGRQPRAFWPLGWFLGSIALAMIPHIPAEVAFGSGVLGIMVTRCMPIRTLYQSIDWSVVIMLAAIIPVGQALQNTGGTELITHALLGLSQHHSPTFVLSMVFIATMMLSDVMSNTATTVIMAPIAFSIAQALHVAIDPFLMAVAISASCSFLTPMGHQNNTLVLGPGGYKFSDYVRVGLPLEILIVAVALPCILIIWPLQG